MLQLANRITAVVGAVMTCVVLIVQMLQSVPPLQSIRLAVATACILAAITWATTMIAGSVVRESRATVEDNKRT